MPRLTSVTAAFVLVLSPGQVDANDTDPSVVAGVVDSVTAANKPLAKESRLRSSIASVGVGRRWNINNSNLRYDLTRVMGGRESMHAGDFPETISVYLGI